MSFQYKNNIVHLKCQSHCAHSILSSTFEESIRKEQEKRNTLYVVYTNNMHAQIMYNRIWADFKNIYTIIDHYYCREVQPCIREEDQEEWNIFIDTEK